MQIPKTQKKTVKLSAFFALLRSVRAKAAQRTFMKLTPGRVRLSVVHFVGSQNRVLSGD